MNLYDRFVLPRLVHYTCSRRPQLRQRAKVAPAAAGEVLEIGFGSGLNLPYYDRERIRRLWALEPADEMWALARDAVRRAPFAVERLPVGAEELPLDDRSVDSVVVLYTLCTIPDAERAMAEIARVLRPDGALLFCEHGLAPDAGVRRWQRRLTPLWKRLAGGCHLDRDVPALLRAGGFAELELSELYLPGWRPASYNYWGRALRSGRR